MVAFQLTDDYSTTGKMTLRSYLQMVEEFVHRQSRSSIQSFREQRFPLRLAKEPRLLEDAGLIISVVDLEMHHGIEEQHIFPVLAKRMDIFKKGVGEHLEQHKHIHAGTNAR